MRPSDLYLIEQHGAFASILRSRFPGATVLESSAETVARDLASLAGTVDYVISGLPIVWFNRDKKSRILEQPSRCFGPRAACINSPT